MPGYEKERFVFIGDTEKVELSCGICHEILREPVVTNCCLQTFCRQCIAEWLKTDSSCPYDRKPLMADELRPASRLLNNLLGKLQITCDYRDQGCPVVTELDGLKDHASKCKYTIRICTRCYCLSKPDHNCVAELMSVNKKESERCDQMRRELQSVVSDRDQLSDDMDGMRHENYRLRQTVADMTAKLAKLSTGDDSQTVTVANGSQNMTKPGKSLIRTSSTMSLPTGDVKPTIYEMLREARRHLNQRVSVTECNTSDVWAKHIVDVVKSELRVNNNMYYICQNIVYKLDHQFGSSWCVITNYDKHGHNYTNSCCYVKLMFGKLTFKVYRTKFLDVPLLSKRIRDGKVTQKINIFDTDMPKDMIKYIEQVTFVTLKKHKTLKSIASEMVSKMNSKYGNIGGNGTDNNGTDSIGTDSSSSSSGHKWNCFAHNYGDYCLDTKSKSFISYDVEDLKLTIFQTN